MDRLLRLLFSQIPMERRFVLAISENSDGDADLLAQMSLHGSFFVVVGNDRQFPLDELACVLGENSLETERIFNTSQLIRACTCWQLRDALQNKRPYSEPLLALDFLHSFYDIDIELHERMRVLHQCINLLETLALSRPVIVLTICMEGPDYRVFGPVLKRAADIVLEITSERERALQLPLL
jgi:hypothetical protein